MFMMRGERFVTILAFMMQIDVVKVEGNNFTISSLCNKFVLRSQEVFFSKFQKEERRNYQ